MLGYRKCRPQQIQRAREILPIVSVQNQYNVGDRDWENTLAYCEKEKLGFMPWSPIGGSRGLKNSGALEATAKAHNTSTVQVALAWLLQRSPVMLPIPGTSSLAHLEENVAAASLKLTSAEFQAIDAMARPR